MCAFTIDPVTEASVLATSSMVLTTNDSVWTLEVGTTQKLLHSPVVCDWRWWWPLHVKWVSGLAMQTVNRVPITQTFSDSVEMIVFSAGTWKTCVVVMIVFVILLQSLLELPVNYQGRLLYWKKERKETFLLENFVACYVGYRSLPSPHFFVGLFLLVVTVSFPYVPLHPSWALVHERPFQPVAGEKQTLRLALCFPIPDPVNKGKHWICEALHAWQFSSVCENCRGR